MFGRTLTSIVWGMLADRVGRKPVIVISTFSMLAVLFSMNIMSIYNQLMGHAYATTTVLHRPLTTCGFSFVYQAYIQYFVWIKRELLDGNSYKISSWFVEWFTWYNESMMTEETNNKALWIIRASQITNIAIEPYTGLCG